MTPGPSPNAAREDRCPVAARRATRPRIDRRALIALGCAIAVAAALVTIAMLRLYPPSGSIPPP